MKIVNGILIFEQVPCWDCEGNKVVTRYTICPNNGKSVIRFPGRQCPHCKAKTKWNHQTTGSYQTGCTVCNGEGTRMENEYDMVTQELWNQWVPSFKWSVSRVNRGGTFNEQYLGIGVFMGMTDYGRTKSKSDEQILKDVPFESHPGQPISWLRKGSLVIPSEMVIQVRDDGYTVYAVWSE